MHLLKLIPVAFVLVALAPSAHAFDFYSAELASAVRRDDGPVSSLCKCCAEGGVCA